MADSIREKIMAAVVARLETVTTANGYETDLGSSVWLWRDFDSAPFPEGVLEGVSVKDMRADSSGEGERLGTTRHDLEVTIEGATISTSSVRDKRARKMLADCIKAIGTDRYWTVSGTRLAWDTRVNSHSIDVKQGGEVLGGFQLVITIMYRTPDFDPYNVNH